MNDPLLVCTPAEFMAAKPTERRKLVRAQIDLTPELYDQESWTRVTHCGSAYCFGGWTLVLAGRPLPVLGVGREAGELLGLSLVEHALFWASNSLEQIDRFLAGEPAMEVFGLRC